MHYYQFNIADYRKDTGHLSNLEHGVYRQLLDWYYLDEKPIPKETQVVLRRLRLASSDEAKALENVLAEFFTLTDDGYSHGRCDEEITRYQAKASANQVNGKKGGRPKKPRKNPEKTQSVILGNPDESQSKGNHKPLTINQEPITKETKQKASAVPAFVPPDWIPVDTWDAYCKVRTGKRAKNEPHALGLIVKDLEKYRAAGHDPIEVLNNSIKSGWTGVFEPKGRPTQIASPGKHAGFKNMDYLEGIEEDGSFT